MKAMEHRDWLMVSLFVNIIFVALYLKQAADNHVDFQCAPDVNHKMVCVHT